MERDDVREGVTREEFVRSYMARSRIEDYQLDGERVTFGGHVKLALPCNCGDEGCEGWAMVYRSGRNFHLFQYGPDEGRPTYDEANRLDALADASPPPCPRPLKA